ncbi:uncharacterized protein H6S33_006126 [Morchella sextelata]|uniref:uncharacterized protein n=1 Tax=Morchella sextelata TaxID=1174677 RepID=UPI001D04D899|nr:uncharacterized protein H6S33_006126 [Morchella sextelata]KAH0614240.1 hypothetical protein H6S33_006126 [Morchella sextelata]
MEHKYPTLTLVVSTSKLPQNTNSATTATNHNLLLFTMGLIDNVFKTKAVREDKRSSRLIKKDNKAQVRTSSSTLCRGCNKHFVLNGKICERCETWSKVPQKLY